MDLRKIETTLARFTLGVLVIYFPVETWTSIPHGLLNPFYLIDLVAMILLFLGALRSLRARPSSAPAVLCAAYAWTAANGWRATMGRILEVQSGGTLAHGIGELWAVGIATTLALACFVLSIVLVIQAEPIKR